MNVCHIISGDLWAGAEIMALSLLRSLSKYQDVRLFVILLNHGNLSTSIKENGIDSVVLEESSLSFPAILIEIARLLRKNHQDIVHSHRYKENLLAYLASRFVNAPRLVTTQHGMPEFFHSVNSLTTCLKRRINYWVVSKKFDKLVAVSSDIKRSLTEKHGFMEDRVEVIRNGIEITAECQLRKNNDRFVVGSAGRLFPIKDYPLLIEIAREVSTRSSEIIFELAGDGPERYRLQALIDKHGLQDHVHLRGFVADMPSFYNELDLYINTSVHEGIPMSVLEAMAHGLPIIAPKVGGFKEIIQEDVEGFLFSSRDPSNIARTCIALSEDRETWRRMSIAASLKATEQFSAERMALQYLRLYRFLSADLKELS